jgi:hypothetical protein
MIEVDSILKVVRISAKGCNILRICPFITYLIINFVMDVEDSLVTKEDCQSMVASQNDKPKTKITKKKIIIISVSIVIELALIVAVVLITLAKPDNVLQPVKIRIALPADRPTQIELGRSRVLEVLFYSGRDNRTIDDFMNVVNRDISWSTNPEGIITVDPYGRV